MTTAMVSCEHCGRCLEVCPTYQAARVETLSSRGRWDLIAGVAAGALRPGPRYLESLSLCINCMACSAVCPKGVDTELYVREARAAVQPDSLMDRLKRAAFRGLLAWPGAVRRSARHLHLAARVRRLFRNGGGPVLRHLPAIAADFLEGRAVPVLGGPTLFDRFPGPVPAAPEAPGRGPVTYYAGCFNTLVDTGPAEAAIRVLAHNGYRVSLPPGQTCCGAPVLRANADHLVRRAMARNLEALAGPDPVVVSCATCGSMLRHTYPALAADAGAGLPEAAAGLAGRTVDLLELLVRDGGPRAGSVPIEARVTIHDPCHLVRGQGVAAQLRQALAAIPGLEIAELAHPDRCCGGGGTYSLSHPDMAQAIGRLKVDEIVRTGADLVVTACPGCVLQIQRELARAGRSIPVLQPAELLARSYGFPSGSGGRPGHCPIPRISQQ